MNFSNRFKLKYKNTPNIYGDKPIPALNKALEFVSGKDALDLGAGSGRNTLYLLEKELRVTAVDSSAEGLEILKQKSQFSPNLIVKYKNVLEYKFDQKFDLILSIGLMHFLELEESQFLFKRIQKNTKINGINLIVVKMSQNRMGDLPNVFEEGELKQFYLKENWEVLKYQESQKTNRKIAIIIARKVSL